MCHIVVKLQASKKSPFLRFMCIFISGTSTCTNQLFYLLQINSGSLGVDVNLHNRFAVDNQKEKILPLALIQSVVCGPIFAY